MNDKEATKQERLAQEIKTASIAVDLAEAERSKLDLDLKPFASLLSNEKDVQLVFAHLERAIFRSFAIDLQRDPFGPLAQRGITASDIRKRFRICEQWFRRARGDLGLSLTKTLDLMGHALRCGLDGQDFDPNRLQTRLWTPT